MRPRYLLTIGPTECRIKLSVHCILILKESINTMIFIGDLDIEKAIATTRFTANGITYIREAFTSFPDRLLIIKLTASKKKSISFTAHYTTPYTENTEFCISPRKELQLNGKANDHEGIEGKIRFTALTRLTITEVR